MSILIRGLTDVDSSAKYAVGTRIEDGDGNVFIYLQGLDLTVKGTLVTYRTTSTAAAVTVILASGGVGLVAIAMAAITTGKFGWYMIAGNHLEVVTSKVDIALSLSGDAVMADMDALIVDATGELFIANGSVAITIEDVFTVDSTHDLTDDALATAKSSAVAAGDVYRVNKVTTVATVEYIPPAATPGTAVYAAANTGVIATPVSDTKVVNGLINRTVFSVEEIYGKGGMTIKYPFISGVLPSS